VNGRVNAAHPIIIIGPNAAITLSSPAVTGGQGERKRVAREIEGIIGVLGMEEVVE
jgi:hypothetical protein